jgi:two-component system, LytTR family, response regulator
MIIKTIIVDDEPLAHNILEKYISKITYLELIENCYNAMEAISSLRNNKVDLMFLDIKMPGLTGIQFLKSISNPPKVIITSAYSEYALEGYEYSVSDYLLKPISFERFLKAVNKIEFPLSNNPVDSGEKAIKYKGFIFLKADKVNYKIEYNKLKYIEGCGNYIKVFTDEKMLLVSETMSEIENKLPKELFLRIHKSYIVSLQNIQKCEKNLVVIEGKTLPIGNTYKREIEKILK